MAETPAAPALQADPGIVTEASPVLHADPQDPVAVAAPEPEAPKEPEPPKERRKGWWSLGR
jgi:hypothetical protein